MRVLQHKLQYIVSSGRWKCRCGYILGDGHKGLYGPCKPKPEREPLIEAGHLTGYVTKRKLPAKTKAIVELFDMARGPKPKPKRKKK